MNKCVAVSLENEHIKVVHGDFRHGSIVIGKTFTFSGSEFDNYLTTTKDDEFIVVNDFQNMYQEIISVPPAKDNYLRALVELEIRKRAPELKEFTFFHEELQDLRKEGKRSKEVFVFAVAREEIDPLLDRFNRYGKIVSLLFPGVLPLARFLRIEEDGIDIEAAQPLLGVVDLGTNKTMFLAREGKLSFVRVAQSEEKGIGELDVENINMTVAYCRQVLRFNPSRVVYLGAAVTPKTNTTPTIPVASAVHPAGIVAFGDTVQEYVIPIAAMIHGGELKTASLLPSEYQGIYVQRKVMSYAILFLLLFSFLGIGYIGIKATESLYTGKEIKRVRQEIALQQPVIADYEKTAKELKKVEPLITFMNMMSRSPDVQKSLANMQVLAMSNVYVKSVNMRKDEKNEMVVQIEGSIGAGSYRELQDNYERLLGAIKDGGGLEIISQGLDLRAKTFKVDMRWKT